MIHDLSGVVPPVVTPLTRSGDLDVDALERSVERMLAAGVDGLFFLGSSGEVAFSTDERRREIVSHGVRIVAGRVPVLVGAIDMQTERVAEHARAAVDLGADAIVATAPFYALGGPAEVERHFRVLADRTAVPLFAYDLPVCVHTKLSPELLLTLGRDGVIAGVKDSSGDDVSFRMLARANRAAGEPLRLFTGHEVAVDGAYLSGAHGSVPGLANVDPAGYVRQWRAFRAGDWEAVRREQDRLADLMRITCRARDAVGFGAGVGAFKTALQLLGVFSTNRMPEPVAALSDADAAAIREILVEAKLLA